MGVAVPLSLSTAIYRSEDANPRVVAIAEL